MQILSIAYADAAQTALTVITTDSPEGLRVPWPSRNWHREVIDAWLAAGNTIGAYVAPPEPPIEATPLQLYDEMDQVYGVDLETEIGAISAKALRRFRLAGAIKSTDQFALAIQARLSWTDAQRETLFRAAAARG